MGGGWLHTLSPSCVCPPLPHRASELSCRLVLLLYSSSSVRPFPIHSWPLARFPPPPPPPLASFPAAREERRDVGRGENPLRNSPLHPLRGAPGEGGGGGEPPRCAAAMSE